jgi:hypothetical protein
VYDAINDRDLKGPNNRPDNAPKMLSRVETPMSAQKERECVAKRVRVEQGRLDEERCGTVPNAVKARRIMRTLSGSPDAHPRPPPRMPATIIKRAPKKNYAFPLHPRGAFAILGVGAVCGNL